MTNSDSQHKGLKRWRKPLMAGLLVAAAFVTLAWPVGGQGTSAVTSDWLQNCLTSSSFQKYALVTLFSAGALAVLGGILWKAGCRGRKLARSEEGGAMVEFAMVLPIALILVLIITQAAWLMIGNLSVHYAAYCAARAAIVVIPSDGSPSEYPNFLEEPGASGKYDRIHAAAVWAVLPVSSPSKQQNVDAGSELPDGMRRFFESYNKPVPGWVGQSLRRKLQYARDNTEVEVGVPENDAVYARNEDIRVRVTHTLYLPVPYANVIFSTMDKDGVELDFGSGEYGTKVRATCMLTNEGQQDYVDIEKFWE